MIPISTPLQTAMDAPIREPGYLIDITWQPGTVTRLSTRGDQSWDGQTWMGGRTAGVTPLDFDSAGEPSGKLTLIDADEVFWALIGNLRVADAPVRMWLFYGDAPGADDVIPMPDAVIDGVPDIGPKITLTLAAAGARTQFSPRQFLGEEVGITHIDPPGKTVTWGGQTIITEGGA